MKSSFFNDQSTCTVLSLMISLHVEFFFNDLSTCRTLSLMISLRIAWHHHRPCAAAVSASFFLRDINSILQEYEVRVWKSMIVNKALIIHELSEYIDYSSHFATDLP